MKKIFTLFFFCIYSFCFGQKLHHQIVATQGGNFIIKSGFIFRQSVGQMSAIGNSASSKTIVQQGFQQGLTNQFFPIYNANTIQTILYPNPFQDVLNIAFSSSIGNNLSISVFNMSGVLLFNEVKMAPQSLLSFNLQNLPAGSYVLNLNATNYTYSKTIIKL